ALREPPTERQLARNLAPSLSDKDPSFCFAAGHAFGAAGPVWRRASRAAPFPPLPTQMRAAYASLHCETPLSDPSRPAGDLTHLVPSDAYVGGSNRSDVAARNA